MDEVQESAVEKKPEPSTTRVSAREQKYLDAARAIKLRKRRAHRQKLRASNTNG